MAKKYFTDESLATLISETKSYTDNAVSTKADKSHTHPVATQTDAGLLSAEDKIQLDYGGIPIVTASSTDGVNYTATVDGMSSFTVGMTLIIVPNKASTNTSVKLNVNNLGAKSIRMPIAYNTSLTATGPVTGWLVANKPITVQWNGTYWITSGFSRPAAQYLYGTVPVESGGTGATDAATALTNLGLTATADEVNKLDGLATTATELGYVSGVTSSVQAQLDSKLPLSGGQMTGTIDFNGVGNPIDFGSSGWIRGKTTSGSKFDIFGYSNPTTLQVGGTYPALALRGKNERPTYNGSDIALLSDIAQPDWNQNDPTAPDYIKNRPFYTADPVEVVILQEQMTTYEDNERINLANSISLTVGETYIVNFDGVEYECVAYELYEVPVIGNGIIANGTGGNGEPFLIVSDYNRVYCSNAGTHTVSISAMQGEIIKIPDKYLPKLVGKIVGTQIIRTEVGDYKLTSEIFNSYTNVASGTASHAEGFSTEASGEYSHAEGRSTIASGDYSHAEGSSTTASGEYSHAEGNNTKASGNCSHAEGSCTKASSDTQHVQGIWNIEDTSNTYAHIVGNGDWRTQSNAHTLDWDGNAWFAGDVYVGSTSGTNKDEGSKKLITSDEIKQSDLSQTDSTQPDYVKGVLRKEHLPEGYPYAEKIFDDIIWDGNTTGKISVDNLYYKISDKIFSVEEIMNSTIQFSDGQIVIADNKVGQYSAMIDNSDSVCAISDIVIIVRQNNAQLGSLTFPETGIYFSSNRGIYVSSLTNKVTYTMSEEYLPVIPVEKGGTGATTAAAARTNLGINSETWTFTLEDGSTVTKAVYVG